MELGHVAMGLLTLEDIYSEWCYWILTYMVWARGFSPQTALADDSWEGGLATKALAPWPSAKAWVVLAKRGRL